MTTLEQLNQEIEESQRRIALSKEQFPFFLEQFNKIENPVFVYFYPNDAKIIAQVKTRAEFAPIRAIHKGKWAKGIDSEKATYRASVNDIEVIVHVSEFPPSCRIVEETVHIEAHDEIKRTVVCSAS